MMDPTRSRGMPSCSAIDLAEIRRFSKISSWNWSIISGVVGLRTYQHPCTQSCHMTKKGRGGLGTLEQEFPIFPKIYEPSQNSRSQKGNVMRVPYWRPTNTRRQSIKCRHTGDFAPGICAPLLCSHFLWCSYDKYRQFQLVRKCSVLLCGRINGFGRIVKICTPIWTVKFIFEQATKAQKWSTGVALFFL